MLVAYDVPRRPPGSHERVIGLGYEYGPKTFDVRLVVFEVHGQLVHALQVEEDASLGAVDLEGVVVPAAWSEPRGLEGTHRPVLEACQKSHGVVHGVLSGSAVGCLERPLPDKRFLGADDLCYRADEEVSQIDDVGAYIPEGARPGHLPLEAPDHGHLRVEDEVLQVHSTPVPDLAEPSLLDELLRELDGGRPPVVEADHAHGANRSGGFEHLTCLLQGVCQRFLAEDVLAGFERGDSYLVVSVPRRSDINEVYVVALQEAAVVRLIALPPQKCGGALHARFVASADGAHPRGELAVEAAPDLAVGVGVGAPHELVPDETAPDLSTLYVHHASPGCSVMTVSLRKLTAFVNPSFTLMKESSCSMEITPSYPASRSSLTKARQNSGP